MLFMVIETYPNGDYASVGERFRRLGRMLPEGVEYVDSWIDLTGTRCYQLMESPRVELLQEWTKHWADLVDFEIVPVLTSVEFWARMRPSTS